MAKLVLREERRYRVNRLCELTAPKGAKLIAVDNPQGPKYALSDPAQYLPDWDVIARRDVEHHYVWVADADVCEQD
jgi:hypothetical protein